MMIPWKERPTEVANLLNPAFLAVLIRDSVKDYRNKCGNEMSYSLPFIVLPIVLHRSTREKLPSSTRTALHTWFERKPDVRIGFSSRAKRLSAYVREGLLFGLQREIFRISESGKLTDTNKRLGTLPGPESADHQQCRKQAKFLGRWFAKLDDPETIYTLWGVRP